MKWIKEVDGDLKIALEFLFRSQFDSKWEFEAEDIFVEDSCSVHIPFFSDSGYFCRMCKGEYGHVFRKKMKCPKAEFLMKYFEHEIRQNKVYFIDHDDYTFPY